MYKRSLIFATIAALVFGVMTPSMNVYAVAEQAVFPEELKAIDSGEELLELADWVDENGSPGSSTMITVTEDITVTGAWNGIGAGSNAFSDATFDGQGHTITLPDGGAGLFGAVDHHATIKNVIINSTGTLRGSSIGAVASYCVSGTIYNCGNLADVYGSSYAGGIVGTANNISTATIEACFNAGNITGGNAGGITASNFVASVNRCYNTGTITVSSNGGYGAGIVAAEFVSSIINCYNAGVIKTTENSAYLGEIVGTGIIDYKNNCYYNNDLRTDQVVTNHSIAKTTEQMLTEQFMGESHWIYENGFYPQLSCFAGNSASRVSAAAAVADSEINDIVKLSTGGTWRNESFGSQSSRPSYLIYEIDGYQKEVSLAGIQSEKVKLILGEMGSYPDATIQIPYGGVVKTSVWPNESANLEWYYLDSESSDWKAAGESEIEFEDYGVTAAVDGGRLKFSGKGILGGNADEKVLQVYAIDQETGSCWRFLITLRPTRSEMSFEIKADSHVFENSFDEYTMIYRGSAPVLTWQAKIGSEPVAEDELTSVLEVTFYEIDAAANRVPGTESQTAPSEAGTYELELKVNYDDRYLESKEYVRLTIGQKEISELAGDLEDYLKEEMLYEDPDSYGFIYKEFEIVNPEVGSGEAGKLTKGTDYTVQYFLGETEASGADDLGKWKIVITGQGNYTGTITGEFDVKIGSTPITLNKDKKYELGGNSLEQWYLSEQPEIKYNGGISFYVKDSGKYEFQKVN